MSKINDIEKEIRQYDKLIYKITNSFKFVPEYIEKDELKQVVTIALWQALQKHKEVEGVKKINYLYREIKFDVIDWLRKMKITVGREYLPECELSEKCIEDSIMDGLLINEIKRIISDRTEADIFIDRYVHQLPYKKLESKYCKSRYVLKRIVDKVQKQLKNELDWTD